MTSTAPSSAVLRDLYTKMLLTRIVDDCTWRLYAQGYIDFVTSSRGHEAAQVGSAVCIEVGQDFTLPYYRDLGVVLTIGMTPYEVFRTCLHFQRQQQKGQKGSSEPSFQHWGYQKHNTITGPTPVATQLLHAAGIAFASKLRKAAVVTIAYCGDDATKEPDFAEGMQFASQHALPVIFICEQDCTQIWGTDSFATSLPPLACQKTRYPQVSPIKESMAQTLSLSTLRCARQCNMHARDMARHFWKWRLPALNRLYYFLMVGISPMWYSMRLPSPMQESSLILWCDVSTFYKSKAYGMKNGPPNFPHA
nr:thiamine pyrophosphate-dependent enzyme [Dictyobacter kobayashii]